MKRLNLNEQPHLTLRHMADLEDELTDIVDGYCDNRREDLPQVYTVLRKMMKKIRKEIDGEH